MYTWSYEFFRHHKEFWIKIIYFLEKKIYENNVYLKLLSNLFCLGHVGDTSTNVTVMNNGFTNFFYENAAIQDNGFLSKFFNKMPL